MDTRYTVRQTVEMTGVKAYVLRYWEDELELRIQRNEMGHRYYTGYDIQLFLKVKELKKRGLQLRAIKDLVPQLLQQPAIMPEGIQQLPEEAISEKTGMKKAVAKRTIPEAAVPEKEPVKDPAFFEEEKILEFQAILERLITQEIQSKNEEEERCRSLDLAIRRQQLARREAAAASEKKQAKRRRNT